MTYLLLHTQLIQGVLGYAAREILVQSRDAVTYDQFGRD